MNLIFLHGVPGVGKRTIAMDLARELNYPFLNFHHLAALLGPVFGYSSPDFNDLRDDLTRTIIEKAMTLMEDGVISTFTYEPSIPLTNYRNYIDAAVQSGGMGLFVGLTCDDDELKGRVETPERQQLEKVNDYHLLEDGLSSGTFDVPELPGPSITLDTSGEPPETTVQNIIAMLPNEMKRDMMF